MICDDDEQTAINCFKFYRKVRIVNATSRQRLAAITFADDKSFRALQAADMLSSLMRLDTYRQFYDYKPLFDHLTKPRRPSFIQWKVGYYGKMELLGLSHKLERIKLG